MTTQSKFVDLHLGRPVRTMDGKTIGRVDRIEDEAFHLTMDPGEPLWLSRKSIWTADIGAVTLVCQREGLPNYSLDR